MTDPQTAERTYIEPLLPEIVEKVIAKERPDALLPTTSVYTVDVLGGRAMEIVYSDSELEHYMNYAVQVEPEHPILIDKFLENAIEVDVDALADRTGRVVIGGIMEHIEEAGVHSGDSACSLPYISLPESVLDTIRQWTIQLARALKVIGLLNIQYAVRGEQVYILEANPRASRTVPYASKAIGVPLAKLASRIMSGETLDSVGFTSERITPHVAVKEVVLPFNKFAGADTLLGPEMRSTGEVMGIDTDFGRAFAKAELAAGVKLSLTGTVLMSMSDRDKQLKWEEVIGQCPVLIPGQDWVVNLEDGTQITAKILGTEAISEI